MYFLHPHSHEDGTVKFWDIRGSEYSIVFTISLLIFVDPFFLSLSLIPPSIPLFSLLPPLLSLPPSLSPSLPSFLHLPHATVFIFVSPPPPPPPLSSHTFLSTSPSHQSQCVCCTPQAVAVSSAPWTQTS